MRTMLLASAALFGLAIGAPAFAQDANSATPAIPPAATPPGTTAPSTMGQSGEQSPAAPTAGTTATGMTPQDQGTMPKRPMHTAGTGGMAMPADGSPQHYLSVAKTALGRHRPREAEDALAFAETRLLDRSVPASAASEPDSRPAIQAITEARDAIGKRDWQTAQQSIDRAMNSPGVMAGADTMNGGSMNGGSMNGGSMNGGAASGSGGVGNGGMSGNGSLPSSDNPPNGMTNSGGAGAPAVGSAPGGNATPSGAMPSGGGTQ